MGLEGVSKMKSQRVSNVPRDALVNSFFCGSRLDCACNPGLREPVRHFFPLDRTLQMEIALKEVDGIQN